MEHFVVISVDFSFYAKSLKDIFNWRSEIAISQTSLKVFSLIKISLIVLKDLTFLNTGITVFFSLFGNVISPPGIWFEVDPMNLTVTLWDIYWRTDMTITYYYDELFNRSVNSDQLREIKILNQYYQETDYYESTVLLPYNFIETTVFL
jgi:hypothetical protein